MPMNFPKCMRFTALLAVFLVCGLAARPAGADTFFFSTGDPDGKIATLSRPGGPGLLETESADDFVLTNATRITGGGFTGLLPTGASLSDVHEVVVEIYRVFPKDSQVPPSSNVPTRVNSPSDVAFATRDTVTGNLSFTSSVLNSSFTASNSVVNGIHPSPGEFTGGEGAVTGEEVAFTLNFTTPLDLPADHYFFVPQVELTTGNFLWLSAPRPIVPPGTPFPAGFTDLQTWIRNADLDPDWLRVGTDITHQGPFNAAFSLTGATVPEPSTLLLLGVGVAGAAYMRRRMTKSGN